MRALTSAFLHNSSRGGMKTVKSASLADMLQVVILGWVATLQIANAPRPHQNLRLPNERT